MGVSTAGACSDTFTVVGPSFSPGHTLCGTLTGQHCNSIWMENFKKYIYLTTFYTSICWKCSCHNYHKIDIYDWNNYDHSNLECKSISNRMLFQNEVLLLWNVLSVCTHMWGWFAMSGLIWSCLVSWSNHSAKYGLATSYQCLINIRGIQNVAKLRLLTKIVINVMHSVNLCKKNYFSVPN